MTTNSEEVKCPECGSHRLWKDGIHYTDHGKVQRYRARITDIKKIEGEKRLLDWK